MAYPARPPTFSLASNSRLLKRVVQEFVSSRSKATGITDEDIEAAENYAWRTIVSSFITQYDVSDWGTDPPHPLFEIFDLLASSYALKMQANRQNIKGEPGERSAWKEYLTEARNMIKAILDPPDEGERLSLVTSAGDEVYPREDVAIPVVEDTTGVIFFPAYDDTTSHDITTDQSAEELYRRASKQATTS